jgi:hypothetical protein
VVEQPAFRCPQCDGSLDSAVVVTGERFTCPGCKHIFRAAKEEDGRYVLTEYIKSICTHCQQRQHVRRAYKGQEVVCVRCGQGFNAEPEPISITAALESQAGNPEQGGGMLLRPLTPVPVGPTGDLAAAYKTHAALLKDKLERTEQELERLRRQHESCQNQTAQLERLQVELRTTQQNIEQLQTSLQIERKANAATLEELRSFAHERELLREEIHELRLERDRMRTDCLAAVEEAQQLRSVKGAWEESLKQAKAERQEALARLTEALGKLGARNNVDALVVNPDWEERTGSAGQGRPTEPAGTM